MNGGRIFGRTEAGYLDERRPDIWMNGGRIFGRTEAGYSDKRRPEIRMNSGLKFFSNFQQSA